MKQTSTSKMPVTSDDDAPKLTQAAFDGARLRIGGKDVSRAEWQAAVRARVGKQRINIMLDAPVVEHFKAAAGGRGYQTLINEALREAIRGQDVVDAVRQVVRDELGRVAV
jgi:uncharacterized protein (DUF4415 family)